MPAISHWLLLCCLLEGLFLSTGPNVVGFILSFLLAAWAFRKDPFRMDLIDVILPLCCDVKGVLPSDTRIIAQREYDQWKDGLGETFIEILEAIERNPTNYFLRDVDDISIVGDTSDRLANPGDEKNPEIRVTVISVKINMRKNGDRTTGNSLVVDCGGVTLSQALFIPVALSAVLWVVTMGLLSMDDALLGVIGTSVFRAAIYGLVVFCGFFFALMFLLFFVVFSLL